LELGIWNLELGKSFLVLLKTGSTKKITPGVLRVRGKIIHKYELLRLIIALTCRIKRKIVPIKPIQVGFWVLS